MKIAPDEIRGKRPDRAFASCRDAANLPFPARPASCDCPEGRKTMERRNLLTKLISEIFPEFAVHFAETRTINSWPP
jgi:hypothetical protein